MTTAKKTTAAKKTAASRSTSSSVKDETTQDQTTPDESGADGNDGTDSSQGDGAPLGQTRQDFGPGTTGGEAPPEREGSRPPATIVNGDPNAAPLDPPADSHTQTQPALGYDTSTTDQAYAEAAGRTIAGENHLRLVDDDGNELSADDLFDESDPNLTFVTTKQRINEVFTYPNTNRESGRLMYVAGARVPKFQAARIKAAVSAAAEAGPVPSAQSEGTGTLRNP